MPLEEKKDKVRSILAEIAGSKVKKDKADQEKGQNPTVSQSVSNCSNNVQIYGDGNTVVPVQAGYQPVPDNPNLIYCPACGKYGVFRDADECPTCNYSFKKAQLAAQEEARHRQLKGLSIRGTLVVSVIIIASLIVDKFHLDFQNSFVIVIVIVLVCSIIRLFL